MNPTDFKIAGYMAGGISLVVVFVVLFAPFWMQAKYFNRCVEFEVRDLPKSLSKEQRIVSAVSNCNGG